MTDTELDQLVSRLSTVDGLQPGFQSAHVLTDKPSVIAIDFDNNQNADAYVFAKAVSGATGYAVDPPNGSRVLLLR